MIGGIVAISTMLLLLILLFRLQLLKAANQNINKMVVHERVLLVVFTLVCGLSFVVYSHFWTVKSKEDQITGDFAQSMQTSRQLFNDYETYAAERMKAYCPETEDARSSEILKEGLRLQLLPPQYSELKSDVGKWLDKSEQSINIWNVFLAGDINAICNSMLSWHYTLNNLTLHTMNDELPEVKPFSREEQINNSVAQMMHAKSLYTTMGFPRPIAWITGLLCFAMLYLPWLIQRRSPKSMVTIWGKKKIQYDSSRTDTIKDTPDNVKIIKSGQSLDENDTPTTTEHKAMTLD